MTEPAANAISAIISGACRGAVYVVQLRDTSDGCVRFSVGYHNSGATDWVSRHRFEDIVQCDAACLVLADFLRAEVR